MNFNGSEHLDSKSMQSIKYEHVLKDLIKHNNGAEPAAPHPKNISESLKSQVPWPDTQLSHGRSASFPPLATQHTLFYPQLPEGFHPDLHSWSTLSWGVRLLTGPFPLSAHRPPSRRTRLPPSSLRPAAHACLCASTVTPVFTAWLSTRPECPWGWTLLHSSCSPGPRMGPDMWCES